MRYYVTVINKTYDEVMVAFAATQASPFITGIRDRYTDESNAFDHGIWTTSPIHKVDEQLSEAGTLRSWLEEIVPGGKAAIMAS